MKYATIVVYVGPYFFRQFLENSRSHRNAYNNLISSKNTHQLNGKGIDDSTEYMFDVTDGHQNYQKRGCSDLGIKKKRKVKSKAKDFQTFQSVTEDWDFYNLQLQFYYQSPGFL